ncbi:hypothetical protein D3C73_999330 [compost metagenome]
MQRFKAAIQQHLPVLTPEGEPKGQHGRMLLRQPVQADRNLRNGEQHINKLQCGSGRSLPGVPHQHIGMSWSRAADQPDIYRLHPVLQRIVRAVTRPEHIPVFAHQRANVILAEFDQNIGLQRVQPGNDAAQQLIHCFRHGSRILSGSLPGRRILNRIKAVDKIQLEAVKVPVPDSLLVDAGQILPYFRVTGVCNPCTHSLIHIQQLILESIPGLTVLADERNRVPQHEFHPQIMNAGNMSLQIGNFFGTHPPVPAISITPCLV